MATIPKGKAIHSAGHLKSAITYIQNKLKTNNLQLCDGINICVNSKIALEQMKYTQELYSKNNYKNTQKQEVLAYHFTQNFAISDNDKIDYEKALKLTKETALKHFGTDYQILFATHTDKEFIHTHMIVNSISMNGKKYLSQGKTLSKFRRISDEVCQKYGLHTLDYSKHKSRSGMSYNRWYEKSQNYSWKDRFKLDIDRAVLSSNNVGDLLVNLDSLNYECKFLKDSKGKEYLGIRDKKYKKSYFANTKNFGEGYDLDTLKAKIENKDLVNKEIFEETEVIQIRYKKVTHQTKKYIPNLYKSTTYKLLDLILNTNTIKPIKYIKKYPYSEQNNYFIQTLAKQLNLINEKQIHTRDDLSNCKIELLSSYDNFEYKLSQEISNKNKIEKVLKNLEVMKLEDKEKLKGVLENLDVEQAKENLLVIDKNINICKKKLQTIGQELKVLEDVEKTLDEMEKDTYIENASIDTTKNVDRKTRKSDNLEQER